MYVLLCVVFFLSFHMVIPYIVWYCRVSSLCFIVIYVFLYFVIDFCLELFTSVVRSLFMSFVR